MPFKPTHGMTGTKIYNVWNTMRTRCNNPKHNRYKYYGGAGVTVCERWQSSFQNFFNDMGECPPGHSLDRIDNTEGYNPLNCRWSTLSVQNKNRKWRNK